MIYPAQLQPFTLYGAGATLGDADITLTTFTDIDGETLSMTDFGTKGFGTLEPGSGNQEEQISFTDVTLNANGTATLNGVSSVAFLNPFTETAGLAKSHAGGVRFVISNTSGFEAQFTSPSEVINFTVSPIVPTPTAAGQAANKGYIDSVALAGASDASATAKGIAKLTTAPSSPSNPIAVGATDVATTGASKVIRSKSNSTIDDSLLALTTAGDIVYSDGTDLKRLPLGNSGDYLTAGATAPVYITPSASLTEATTFFAATDITGAQATTLSASESSNADALHIHTLSAIMRQSTKSHFWLNAATTGFTDSGVTVLASNADVYLTTTGTTGGARRYTNAGVAAPTFNKNLDISVWAMLDNVTALDAFIGFGAETDAGDIQENHVLIKRHVAFMVDNATVICSVAGGTTQTVSGTVATLSANAWNLFSISFAFGSFAKFYINGTLVANLNANLPTGTTDMNWFRIGVEGDSGAKTIYYKNGALISVQP